MSTTNGRISRRQVIQVGAAAGVALAMRGALAADAKALPPVLKTIPSTGEKLPAVGIGTNAFGVTSAEELAELKRVLQGLPEQGGKVVDTARGYGSSEEVIGKLLADIGNRDRIFVATKTPLPPTDVSAGKPVLDESFRRLQVSKIDLLQVHNMNGMDSLVPHFKEYKQAGKLRYIGMTTSTDGQYEPIMQAMRTHKPDFVQVDYSIGNRGAVEAVLKLAQDQGAGVLINSPFGGRARPIFPRVANMPVPEWAKEFDAATWAQFFLKYIISHPAVTATIPGTTTMAYLLDNQAGGRGRLPTAAQRTKMEQFWDALPG
jgi:aryl-alcohol dehydrogenase-like predicted oxidoreductase